MLPCSGLRQVPAGSQRELPTLAVMKGQAPDPWLLCQRREILMTDHFHARGRRPSMAARCWRQAVELSLSAIPLAWGLMGVAVQGLRPWRKIMRDVLSHDRLHGKMAVSVPSSAHGTPRAQVTVPMLPCARKACWCHATCRVHRGHAANTGCRVCGTVRCHGPWSVVRGVGVPVEGARSSVGCCPARSSAAHPGPLSVSLHLSDNRRGQPMLIGWPGCDLKHHGMADLACLAGRGSRWGCRRCWATA